MKKPQNMRKVLDGLKREIFLKRIKPLFLTIRKGEMKNGF